jgi:hypothetical protein
MTEAVGNRKDVVDRDVLRIEECTAGAEMNIHTVHRKRNCPEEAVGGDPGIVGMRSVWTCGICRFR